MIVIPTVLIIANRSDVSGSVDRVVFPVPEGRRHRDIAFHPLAERCIEGIAERQQVVHYREHSFSFRRFEVPPIS